MCTNAAEQYSPGMIQMASSEATNAATQDLMLAIKRCYPQCHQLCARQHQYIKPVQIRYALALALSFAFVFALSAVAFAFLLAS